MVDAPRPNDRPGPPLALLVAVVLCGFSSNSLLCRAALGSGAIDAVSFTLVRLGSGTLALALFSRAQGAAFRLPGFGRPVALAAYAVAFSLAYGSVSAGTGALLLFGAVQATMLAVAFVRGEAFPLRKRLGAALASGGLLVLALPGVERPPAGGALLMLGAGAAWGAYTLLGRGSRQPVADTLGSFAGAFLLVLPFLALQPRSASLRGLALAALSGTLSSGAAYSLWYAAVPRLGAVRAAVVQLAVPVLTAAAGAALLAETPGLRWAAAAALTLSGIALAVLGG